MARVLITRTLGQASTLADGLRSLGHQPILIPTLEIVEPSSWEPFDTAVSQLDKFHWLLFTSANAVGAYVRRAGTQVPPDLEIAAIGSATASALEASGLTVRHVPQQATAEAFAEKLLHYALQKNGGCTQFLLVRAESARDVLPDALRSGGAEVVVVPVYRNIVPVNSIFAIQEMFKSPATYPDAITFTSSSTATNLMALLAAAGLKLPPQILRVSIGPITSQTLRELKLPAHVEAGEATVAALIESVVLALNS